VIVFSSCWKTTALCLQCETVPHLAAHSRSEKDLPEWASKHEHGAPCSSGSDETSDDDHGNVAYGRQEDGSYGPQNPEDICREEEAAERMRADGDAGNLPVISLEELQQHVHAESLWVCYGGAVYDITEFIREHPGGAEALVSAGGQDIAAIWQKYQVHFRKDVMSTLDTYRIGTLTEEDAQWLRERAGFENAAIQRPLRGGVMPSYASRAFQRSVRRDVAVWALLFTAPFWWCMRSIFRLLGCALGYRVGNALASLLPCSVPGFGGAAQVEVVSPGNARPARVAVIGGGIGGCSCAYSLAESGSDVTVYESRDQLGGNAQAAAFVVGEDPKAAKQAVKQDLSVLYWAPEYYRNYSALLSALGLEPARVQLPYVVRANIDGKPHYYAQPGSNSGLDQALQPSMEGRFATDLRRYDRMISVIGNVSDFFSWGSSRPSFYKTNMYSLLPFANPFNFIGLKTCAHLFGLSSDFYETVVRPFHGLNLTTLLLDDVPAIAYTILDDISPLHRSRDVMTFGAGTSQEVFQKATSKCKVKLGTRVRQVHCVTPGHQGEGGACASSSDWQQLVMDDTGATSTFDRVVFACPASAAANVLRSSSWMERTLLRGVGYHDELQHSDWRDWLESEVHQDVNCLPTEHRDTLLQHAAFLIDVNEHGREDGGYNVEYTCNLGSFSPAARSAGVAPINSPMFMTQSPHAHTEIDAKTSRGTFSAPRSHPNLSVTNMVITQMLHLVQGRRGVYYCSNWTSPGNGHDLACTSGLAVASAMGAGYPLADPEARRDHRDCRRFMCI